MSTPSTPSNDPFAVLGVPPDADDRALRRAYRSAALQFHPDKNPSPEAAAEFRRISEAYDTLTNPVLRRRFDEQRRAQAAVSAQPPMPMNAFPQFPFGHDPFAQQPFAQQPFMTPTDPFAAFFRQHQAMHENAMRAAQQQQQQQQQSQPQQQQQMYGMMNPMFQFPQPTFSCPPNTKRNSSSVSTRIHTEADGTVVRVTEHVNTCDGVRNVVVETLRQTRDGRVTRQVSSDNSSNDKPIDLS